MTLTNDQIAEAFSRHDFQRVYDHLSDTIVWEIVGGERLAGREKVIEACESSAHYLATVSTRFLKFRVLPAGDCVVVDSTAEYSSDGQPPATIASCDIYRFSRGKVAEITSYTIELGKS